MAFQIPAYMFGRPHGDCDTRRGNHWPSYDRSADHPASAVLLPDGRSDQQSRPGLVRRYLERRDDRGIVTRVATRVESSGPLMEALGEHHVSSPSKFREQERFSIRRDAQACDEWLIDCHNPRVFPRCRKELADLDCALRGPVQVIDPVGSDGKAPVCNTAQQLRLPAAIRGAAE